MGSGNALAGIGNISYSNALLPGGVAGTSGYILTSSGGGVNTWTNPATLGTNHWQLGSNVLAPINVTNDLAVGGNATASSKFQVMGATGNIYTANNTIDWTLNSAVDALNIDTNTLSVDALNNRVGIGTTNPSSKVEISDGTDSLQIAANGDLTFVDADSFAQIIGPNGGGLYISSGTSQDIDLNAGSNRIYVNEGQLEFNASSSDAILDINKNGTSLLRIENEWGGQVANMYVEGRVGIGTTAPTAELDVAGTASVSALTIRGASPGYINQVNGNSLIFRTSPGGDTGLTEKMTLTNAGYLGIGTTSPNTSLQVGSGTSNHSLSANDTLLTADLELDGTMYLDGGQIANSAGTVSFSLSATPATSYNYLSSSSWLIDNPVNVGQAALMVNQGKGGDIFTASASGSTKFVIKNDGKVGIGTTDPQAITHIKNMNNTQEMTILQIDPGTFTTAGTFSGIVADFSSITRSDSDAIVYGIFLNSPTAGGTPLDTVYGLYIAGTNWNYGIVSEDDVWFLSNTTIGDASGDAVTVNSAGWTFSNDTNFSLSGGVNGLSFDTSTLSIDATNDRVGIGTTSPNAKLEVTGDVYLSNGATRNIKIPANIDANGNDLYIMAGSGTSTGPGNYNGGDLYLDAGSGINAGVPGDILLQTTSGNVGIGLTNPSQALQVTGSINTSVQFLGQSADTVSAPAFSWTGNTTTGIYRPAASQIALTLGGTQRALFTATAVTLTGQTTLTASSLSTLTTSATLSLGGATTLTFTSDNATINGSDVADGDLTLQGTSNATRTTSYVLLQPTAGYVGIGTTAPVTLLHIPSTADGGLSTHGSEVLGPVSGINMMMDSNEIMVRNNGVASALYLNHEGGTVNISQSTAGIFSVNTNGLYVNASNSVGIGTTAPGEELDIAGQIQFNLDGAAGDNTIGVCKSVADSTGVEADVEFRDCSGTPGDIAEYYAAEADLHPGDIVSITYIDNKPTLIKTNTSYDKNVFGVVSTYPVGQHGKPLSSGLYSADEYPTAIGLAGKVPVKISAENGPVAPGDPLVSSSIPGVAMKAGKAGKIIGYAIEPYDGSTTVSNEVRVQESMRSGATMKFNLDPQDPTEPGVGKILMAVNNSTYDPDIYLTDSGNLNVTVDQNGNYELTDTTTGNIIDRVGAFAETVAATVRAGAIVTSDFVTENLTAEVANIASVVAQNIQAGVVVTQDLATTSFTAFQGTVDNMLISTGLVAQNVQTDLISPLADSTDVKVQVGSSATPSGKFIVQDTEGSAVASIDNEGNATFSGTLYAGAIESQSLDDIKALLTSVQTDQNLLKDAANWNTLTATNSASLDQIAVADLYVTNQAAINSLSVTNSVTIGSDMVFSSTLNDQSLAVNSIDTLSAPLKIQALAMAPVEIMAGLVTIDTHGNVNISGNLYVAGRVKASGLTLSETDVPENATASALLTLQNLAGSEVASVNASGSAQFGSISTPQLVIAGADATQSGTIINGVISTNSTVGQAVIPAGTSEITIKNPKVTDYTLVYVTPTSSTENNVLYVKSKQGGQFVVGFANPINVDVSFNWWIVQVSQ